MKNSRETRLKAVKEHLEDGLTIKEVAEKYGIDSCRIKFYVALSFVRFLAVEARKFWIKNDCSFIGTSFSCFCAI